MMQLRHVGDPPFARRRPHANQHHWFPITAVSLPPRVRPSAALVKQMTLITDAFQCIHSGASLFDGSNGPLATTFWALFGNWDVGLFGNYAFWTPGPIAVYVYALFANLALVNLLIAMFSDTYASLMQTAPEQRAYQRCKQRRLLRFELRAYR